MMKRILFLALIIGFCLGRPAFAATRFVTPTGAGAMNGSNWANAYSGASLQFAITNAVAGDQIWVAVGTYRPTALADRDIAFSMKSGVAIYGGFQGTETMLSDRVISCGQYSILSGDIGVLGDAMDNSYHVIRNGGNVNATAIIDGFVIRDGYNERTISTGESGNGGGIYNGGAGIGNNCSPTIRNCIIINNYARYGAGIFNNSFNGGQTNPNISRCVIANNTAIEGGGGIDFFAMDGTATPFISDCVIANNTAASAGGMYCWGGNNLGAGTCNPTIWNCVFANNTATSGSAGGIIVDNSRLGMPFTHDGTCNVIVRNSIFWGNTSADGPQFAIPGTGTFTATYCAIDMTGQVGTHVISGAGTGNINSNPLFVNSGSPVGADGCWMTNDDGLQLQNMSPCIDVGDNTGVSSVDIVGQTRIFNATVDMGAYEFRLPPSAMYSGVTFPEAVANDGTITTTRDITLTNETWLPPGVFTGGGTHYTAVGVPAGLSIMVERISAVLARISFTGAAAAHANINDAAITINFTNAAVSGGNVGLITGLNPGALTIDFADPGGMPPTMFIDATPPAGNVGAPYNYAFLANGTPAPTYSIFSGMLPSGLSLDAATGIVSGTPTNSGVFGPIVIRATNAGGVLNTMPFVITINPPIVIVPTPQPPSPPPTAIISNFMPSSGSEDSVVTISGKNFLYTTQVSFGSIFAKSFVVVSDSVLRAVVGGGSTGFVSVVTSNGYGNTAVGVSQMQFTYVPPPPIVIHNFSPAIAMPGTIVIIRGQRLLRVRAVTFGSFVARSFQIISDSEIHAVVGDVGEGGIADVTLFGSGEQVSQFGILLRTIPPPILYSVTPNTIQASGDEFELTLRGEQFHERIEVRLDSARGIVLRNDLQTNSQGNSQADAQTLVVRFSSAARRFAGQKKIIVTNPDGQTASARFVIVPAPSPTIRTLTPLSEIVSGKSFGLLLQGLGFFSNATIQVNGTMQLSRIQSSTQATVEIAAKDVVVPTTVTISLHNADGQSTRATFLITRPLAPVIHSISAQPLPNDARGLIITIEGKYFSSRVTVALSNQSLHVLSATDTHILAVLPASLRPTIPNPTPAVVIVYNNDGQFDGKRWVVPPLAPIATTEKRSLGNAFVLNSFLLSNDEQETQQELLAQSESLRVYPNPAYNHVTVRMNVPTTNKLPTRMTIRIINSVGKMVWSVEARSYSNEMLEHITISGFESGAYWVEIFHGETVWRQSFVIQR
jgi:hypothetical protein